MSDLFLKEDARRVLQGKHVVLLGDSNIRGLYKDIVWLLNDNSFIPYECLGAKGESHFPEFSNWKSQGKRISPRIRSIFDTKHRDTLLKFGGLHSGRSYIEPRIYYHEEDDIHLHFLFITRVWSKDLDEWLNTFENRNNGSKIDVILMSSCLWDFNRWGPFGVKEYKDNLNKLLKRVKSCLPPQGHFVWLTSLPASKEINSKAMQVPGLEFQCQSSRYNVVEANFYTSHKMADNGFHVIDMHYYSLLQSFRRNHDGIHWSPESNRWFTNLVMTYLCLIFNKTLPNRVKNNFSLEKIKLMAEVARGTMAEELTSIEVQKKLEELAALAQTLTPHNKQILTELQKVGPHIQKPKSRGSNRMHPYANQNKPRGAGPARGQNSGRLNSNEGFGPILNRVPVWQNRHEPWSEINMEPIQPPFGMMRQQSQPQQQQIDMGGRLNFSLDNGFINPMFRQVMATRGGLGSGPQGGFGGSNGPFSNASFADDDDNLGYGPGQQGNSRFGFGNSQQGPPRPNFENLNFFPNFSTLDELQRFGPQNDGWQRGNGFN